MRCLTLKVQSVIFDMDGVITDTMPFHYRAWRNVLAQAGISVTRNDVYLREGQRGIQSLLEIFTQHKKTCSIKMAKDLLRQKESIFKKTVRPRFVSGVRHFLKSLYDDHLILAMVTGTSRSEVYKILPDDVLRLFKVIVAGNEVKNGKPHPEPFYRALKKLKLKSSQAVVIENAPLGIESAKSAGLLCLAVETSLPKHYLKKADAIYPSITVLKRKVRFISNNHLLTNTRPNHAT